MKKRQLRGFDLRQLSDCEGLIGVDEAGRGALAGPVAAGAVLITRSFLESDWCKRHTKVINDSKQLTAGQRVAIFERMQWLMGEHRILFAAGTANVAEIEDHNILGATKLAMRRAIRRGLELGQIEAHPPDPLFDHLDPANLEPGQCVTDWKVLVDGKPLKNLGFVHRAIVEGDAKSLVIAMASIVAKVTRDRMMRSVAHQYPGYNFEGNKGYPCPTHKAHLQAMGPSAIHRRSWVFMDHLVWTGLERIRRSDPQLELPFGA
jgi:ribonuclease HII